NKIDKKLARPEEVLAQTEALFLHLAKDPGHLDFKTLYAVGRDAKVFFDLPKRYLPTTPDLTPLFETVITHVPSPEKNQDKPFQMLISTLDYDPYLGRLGIGKIKQGKIKKGQPFVIVDREKKIPARVEKLFTSIGIKREEIEEAYAGDIVSVAAKADLNVNQTLCDPSFTQALPQVLISPPTMKITIGANTSPFAGREGKFVTNRQIQERLIKEKQTNIGLEIEPDPVSAKFIVKGRGELHLAVLIEKLRREGYEMEISKPQVIFKEENKITLEPFVEVNIEVPDEFVGIVTQEMGKRKGELLDMKTLGNGLTRFVYKISERNMIGVRSIFLSATKGTINLSTLFLDYFPLSDSPQRLRNGVIISAVNGKAVAYGLQTVCERGVLFIPAQTEVYEGMIVGLNSKEDDMEVNVSKSKKLTNMHTESSDEAIVLTPPVILSLEQALDFLAEDELLEATPRSLRLRKRYLTHVDRVRAERTSR
ncbi:translational GTPase TypA, partial [Candidatus Microgenomates bacterium]|nr:translational GTPase TypA [Candidatus Microgenomates bacterium]